jgi:LPXTG-site transpeptidase (sortase) family protein
VCLWIAANVAPMIAQDWGNWVFDRQVSGRPATLREYLGDRKDTLLGDVAAEWRAFRSGGSESKATTVEHEPLVGRRAKPGNELKERDLIGRLEIPRLDVKTIVREGAREDTLSIAAGHIPNTALPGQPGNVAVAGHRDTLFRGLQGIRNGDLIQFESLRGSYVYQVESTQIVKPTDVSVLNPTAYSQLTLVTCYPFTFVGSAPERFIVKARQVLASNLKPDLSTIPAVASTPAKTQPTFVKAVEPQTERGRPPEDIHDDSVSRSATGRINFAVPNNHSRQLAPGISMGVSMIDTANHSLDGWIWVMPDRRTVWIEHQPAQNPVVFYQDGKIRELILTRLDAASASGYLLIDSTDRR